MTEGNASSDLDMGMKPVSRLRSIVLPGRGFLQALERNTIEILQEKPVFLRSMGAAMLDHI